MSKADIPAFVGELAGEVEAELAALIDAEELRWSTEDAETAVLFGEMRALVLGGGKRLRPAFCLLGALAAGGADRNYIRRAGAALEMLHAMALFHDDVIDGSTSRRGRETTHVRHERLHREGKWAGESTRFGEGVAILVGDLAYVYADQLMASVSPRVREVWTRMRLEVNLGQYLDVSGSARRNFTTTAAARIALFKTAKYTIERPLHIGAMIADPAVADTTLDALSGYGVALGVAFQMRDDVLGVFGEPEVTGKPAGDDLRESKPTALVAEAILAASQAQRITLDLIGTPNLDASKIDEIRRVIVDTGALESVERRIGELTESAIGALDGLALRDDARDKFVSLAHAIAWRSV
jgi:geranylgeranyl diphosphate synthase type I